MTSGDDLNSWPAGDRSDITFRCDMHVSWDPPKTYVDLTSHGVVFLDTTVVPNVLGLRAFEEVAGERSATRVA